MLLNHFFNIQDTTDLHANEWKVVVKIDSHHPLFKGHFPNKPITPGVVEIQICKEVAESILNKNLELSTLNRCKFKSLLEPSKHSTFEIKFTAKEDNDEIKANFEGFSGDQVFFSFSARYSIS